MILLVGFYESFSQSVWHLGEKNHPRYNLKGVLIIKNDKKLS